MANITRRGLLASGGALAGIGLAAGLRAMPITPAMQLARSALPVEMPSDQMIRLNANENPNGPSRVALQAFAENFDVTNRYHNGGRYLIELLAVQNNVQPENIMIGTGSSEILSIAGLIAGMSAGSVVCADPTYQSLLRYAENAGSDIIRVPVNENHNADLDAMRRAVRNDTKLVYLVNPNNPIPSIIEKNALKDFVLEMAETRIVFVDEAYHEFVDNPDYMSMLELIADGHKNIIVARTASKIHGLAGMRVGFGFADPDLAREMDQRKTGEANILGLKAAYASYQDNEFQEFTIRQNRIALDIVESMCEELDLRYVKSNTNFAFIETGMENSQFKSTMEAHGLLTGRDFPPYHHRWSRVSMSTPAHMRYFVDVYKSLFA